MMFEYFHGFWNWAETNETKISIHVSGLYFYFLKISNSLAWKEKFNISASQAMNELGIASYKTYKKHFDELIEFGLITVVQPSRNQWTSNIIALVKFTEPHTKALPEQLPKQVQSTSHIHKTNKTKDIVIEKPKTFKSWNQDDLKESIRPHVEQYTKETCNDFYNHWREPLPSGKPRMTLEKAWDTKKRLATWKRNESKFGAKSGKVLQVDENESRAMRGVKL